jgi:hypothetical protein
MRLTYKRCLMPGTVMNLLVVFPMLAQPVFADSETRRLQGQGTLFASGVGGTLLKGGGSITVIGKGAGSVWIEGAESVTA